LTQGCGDSSPRNLVDLMNLRKLQRVHDQPGGTVTNHQRRWTTPLSPPISQIHCPITSFPPESLYGIPPFWSAPEISGTQAARSPTNNSATGLAWLIASGESMTPTLITLFGPKDGPSRKRVLPQSPQKCDVIWLPESAFLAIVFGVPFVTLKPSPGTMMLVE
jgi:hypothetical protein